MNTPPFLIAAALLFWGWRTGWWAIAITLAAIFELSRLVKFRWEFTDKEYSRVFDVCTLLFGGSVVYLRFSEEITKSGFVLFQWMPVIFALSLLTQAYGSRDKIPYRVFSWFARIRKDPKDAREGGLNISWPYFGVCLLAAGATNDAETFFYPIALALCGWAAWSTRVKRYAGPIWAACFLLAAMGGLAGTVGWRGLQTALTPILGQAFARWAAKEHEALNSRTTMGEIGSKKGSGRIILRVKSESGQVPSVLRQASFDTLKGTTWTATQREYNMVVPENDVTTWNFLPDPKTNNSVRVSSYVNGKRGLLSLPQGAGRIRELPVGKVETTRLGVARVTEAPGLVSYVADFTPAQTFEAPPSDNDFEIPESEKSIIQGIAAQIKASATTNQFSQVRAVQRYFAQNFSYSLYEKRNTTRNSPLAHFLKTTRKGHCEYFASATTLILRELG
ncbi:MAG TPA: transglutaminase-like domain-containing protein, partial [Verrucomicrobiae bacterium]|nr:transglutaminase-like domain-containing protein [Verrucomicrobiae bacterium]